MKYLKMSAVLVLAATMFVACDSTTPTDDPTTDPETSAGIELAFLQGANYGDYYGTGGENYYTIFSSKDAVFNDDGDLTSGYAVIIDLVSDNMDNVGPKAGTYTFSLDGKPNTFGGYDENYEEVASYKTDSASYINIAGGTIVIADIDGGQQWTMNIIYTDSTKVTYSYKGAITYTVEEEEEENPYEYEPTTPTTLTVNAPADSIEAVNYGDIYEAGTDNITLSLWDDNTAVVLEMFAPLNSTEIPTGTYTFAETGAAQTLLAGELFMSMFPTGSYAATEDAYYWLNDGNVTVAKTGDTYTITANLKSYYGSTINVSYTGAITIEVETDAEAAPKKVRSFTHQFNAKSSLKARFK